MNSKNHLTTYLSGMQILIDDLEKIFDHGRDIAEEDRETYLCINKMLAYLFSSFVSHMEEHIVRNTNENNLGKVRQSCNIICILCKGT